MSGARVPLREADAIRLRTLIDEIDHELSLLPTSEDGAVAGTQPLRRSWAELVALLALGPAPETRLCPTCGQVGMRAATRCGYCWSKLSPLAAGTTVAPGAAAVG